MKELVKESLFEYLKLADKEIIKGEKKTGLSPEDVDSKEFLVGIEVEKEHSSNLAVVETIVLQHLSDNPKYYSEGMKKGIFEEPAAINLYKKYFIDIEEPTEFIKETLDESISSFLKDKGVIKKNVLDEHNDKFKKDLINYFHQSFYIGGSFSGSENWQHILKLIQFVCEWSGNHSIKGKDAYTAKDASREGETCIKISAKYQSASSFIKICTNKETKKLDVKYIHKISEEVKSFAWLDRNKLFDMCMYIYKLLEAAA